MGRYKIALNNMPSDALQLKPAIPLTKRGNDSVFKAVQTMCCGSKILLTLDFLLLYGHEI